MNILMIAINDPAGTAITLTKAINRLTTHTCRLVTKELRYNFLFEKDLHLPWLDKQGWDELEQLLRTSDAFHFHMTADEYTQLGPFLPADYAHDKLLVHHHHGHPDFRGNPRTYRQKYAQLPKRRLIVSTPDLLHLLPAATWLPNLVPLDDPLYQPLADKPAAPVRICHSPTRTELKNTDIFTRVTGELQMQLGTTVQPLLIQHTAHRECLQAKQRAHILFDHMQGYFGVSSLEGLSQGLCVIAGPDDWNRSCISEFACTADLPWVIAHDEHDLATVMRALVADGDLRQATAIASRRFMEHCWTERQVLGRLADIYEWAADSFASRVA